MPLPARRQDLRRCERGAPRVASERAHALLWEASPAGGADGSRSGSLARDAEAGAWDADRAALERAGAAGAPATCCAPRHLGVSRKRRPERCNVSWTHWRERAAVRAGVGGAARGTDGGMPSIRCRCRWRRRRRPARPLEVAGEPARGAPRRVGARRPAENPIRGGTVTVTDGVATIDAALRPANRIAPGAYGSWLCPSACSLRNDRGSRSISGRALRSSSRPGGVAESGALGAGTAAHGEPAVAGPDPRERE